MIKCILIVCGFFGIGARLYEVEQFSLACVLAKEAADTVTCALTLASAFEA